MPLLRRTRRRGMTIVEATLVMSVFLMLLFGLFEYCRFLLVLHITNNAARDGARYAVVNLDKPDNFSVTDFTASKPSIANYTTARMGGVWKQINNVDATHSPNGYQVAVYACDQTGLSLGTPVIRPRAASGVAPYPDPFFGTTQNTDPFLAGAPNAVPWRQAAFTERVAVTIRGTYRPFTPAFLFMPSSIPVRITAVMGSEG